MFSRGPLKRLKFLVISWVLSFLCVGISLAKDVSFHVLPWNGFKAALSMTYDDGDPVHLDVAIPELSKRHLRATFYLIDGKLTRPDEWKKAAVFDQEIGNHTMTHRHVTELTPDDEKYEVVNAKENLQRLCDCSVLTLAYPFTEISPGLRKWVEAENFAARGGGQAGNPYMTPDSNPDWFDIPSQATQTDFPFETYQGWVDQDLSNGAWTVLMIHAIEPSNWFQPISQDTYTKFLDYLVEKKKDLWTAPFGEVASYWRAQKALEAAKPEKDGTQTILHWDKIANFPKEVVLKVKIQGDGLQVSQKGRVLKPADKEKEVYAVSFDAGELTMAPSAGPQPTPTPQSAAQ